jgi:hypothetical protein
MVAATRDSRKKIESEEKKLDYLNLESSTSPSTFPLV